MLPIEVFMISEKQLENNTINYNTGRILKSAIMLVWANYSVAISKFWPWEGEGHLRKDLKHEWHFNGQGSEKKWCFPLKEPHEDPVDRLGVHGEQYDSLIHLEDTVFEMKIRPEVYSGMSRIVPLKGCWCCSSVLFPSFFFLLYLNSFTVDNLISATVQPDSRNERYWLMCGSGWGVAWRISKAHTFGT